MVISSIKAAAMQMIFALILSMGSIQQQYQPHADDAMCPGHIA